MWYLTGFVRERGDSVDAAFARPVSIAGAVRHRVPPRDLDHVTHCVEAPLARSWPDLTFCIAFPDSRVETATRVWRRVSVVSGPATTSDAIRMAASGRVSTATDAGGRCHVDEIDVTTLSAKCQQPSHQSVKNPVIRVSEEQPEGRCSLRCNALRNVVLIRRKKSCARCLDPRSWATSGSTPRICQSCANDSPTLHQGWRAAFDPSA